MSDFEVKMVTVDIEPHGNADALEVAKIRGTEYTSVVPKDRYKTGDEALYIPDQAIIPDWILEELGLTGKLAGSKKNRVKPLSLRGVLSQGILYKPSDKAWALHLANSPPLEEGEYTSVGINMDADWSEDLGITKWVPEVPLDMAGKQYAPDAIQTYTDINDFKKYPDILEDGEHVIITEKIHGTCAIFHLAYGTLHVTSKGVAKRGLAIEEDDSNLYWRVAKAYNIKDKLSTLNVSVVTLFGEIYGVQDLKYGADKGNPKFRVFDIAINGRYISYMDFLDCVNAMNLPTVPVLYDGPFHAHLLPDFAKGDETVTASDVEFNPATKSLPEPQHIREGVVVKPAVERRHDRYGRVIFKYVSPDYLNRKGNTTEYE